MENKKGILVRMEYFITFGDEVEQSEIEQVKNNKVLKELEIKNDIIKSIFEDCGDNVEIKKLYVELKL